MTKTLNIQALIPIVILAAFLLLSVFAAFPANAQEIRENCTLTKNIKINDTIILEGTKVQNGATTITGDTMGGATQTISVKAWGTICLVNTINTVTDWIFFLLVSVAFILILIAGFLWMTSGGDATKQKQAGGMIAAALVGIVIAILSRIIPGIVIGMLS